MSNSHVVRALRQPLTWLVVLAMALLAMLALESAGRGHAPSAMPLSIVAHHTHPSGTTHKHCTDSKGKDNPKNKHCRGISGT